MHGSERAKTLLDIENSQRTKICPRRKSLSVMENSEGKASALRGEEAVSFPCRRGSSDKNEGYDKRY